MGEQSSKLRSHVTERSCSSSRRRLRTLVFFLPPSGLDHLSCDTQLNMQAMEPTYRMNESQPFILESSCSENDPSMSKWWRLLQCATDMTVGRAYRKRWNIPPRSDDFHWKRKRTLYIGFQPSSETTSLKSYIFRFQTQKLLSYFDLMTASARKDNYKVQIHDL